MGITDRLPRSTYYDKHYRQTAALIRARQPYLIRNIFTGLGLTVFTISVYAWTIHAVAQDDFSDIPIPDALPQAAHTPHVGFDRAASEQGLNERKEAAVERAKG
ncbi:MAG: hypothetical protein Q9164_001265 [Protoblastenia rupestris]